MVAFKGRRKSVLTRVREEPLSGGISQCELGSVADCSWHRESDEPPRESTLLKNSDSYAVLLNIYLAFNISTDDVCVLYCW